MLLSIVRQSSFGTPSFSVVVSVFLETICPYPFTTAFTYLTFEGAKKAQGDVTYKIISARDSNNKGVKLFSISVAQFYHW